MVNYHALDNSIVVNYDGKTETVHRGDSRYAKVFKAIQEKRFDDVPDLMDTTKRFTEYGLEIVDGAAHIDGDSLPVELSKRIVTFVEQDLPKQALLNFWRNLKKNPSFRARKMLYKFLEHNGHPLTEDGCFIAYRGVNNDFKDLHSGTFDNSPGAVCEMPRSQVDDDPNNTCSTGLHVACYSYANSFGPKLIEVKVNPADVVAVPNDYNGTKMRVCKFTVVREGEKELTEDYYNSPEPEETEEIDYYTDPEFVDGKLFDCKIYFTDGDWRFATLNQISQLQENQQAMQALITTGEYHP